VRHEGGSGYCCNSDAVHALGTWRAASRTSSPWRQNERETLYVEYVTTLLVSQYVRDSLAILLTYVTRQHPVIQSLAMQVLFPSLAGPRAVFEQ